MPLAEMLWKKMATLNNYYIPNLKCGDFLFNCIVIEIPVHNYKKYNICVKKVCVQKNKTS